MNNSLENYIYLFLILIFIVSFILQIYLSKRKDKISGLILPAIYLLRSFRTIFQLWGRDISMIEILPILLFQNIPTIIFIVIYNIYRKKIRRKAEIEKMNIQDL